MSIFIIFWGNEDLRMNTVLYCICGRLAGATVAPSSELRLSLSWSNIHADSLRHERMAKLIRFHHLFSAQPDVIWGPYYYFQRYWIGRLSHRRCWVSHRGGKKAANLGG